MADVKVTSEAAKKRGAPEGQSIGGKARYLTPLLASCVGLLLATLLMCPMLLMEPRDVPVAILSLDEGATLDGESINAGDIIVGELTGNPVEDLPDIDGLDDLDLMGGDDNDSPTGYVSSDAVHWLIADSADQFQQMLDDGECYAAMTIPKDFSRAIVASAGRAALGAQLVEKLPDLAEGATALSDGAATLEEAVSTLAEGVANLTSSATALSAGVSDGSGDLQSLVAGVSPLIDGLSALNDGATQISTGTTALHEGSVTLAEGLNTANDVLPQLPEETDNADIKLVINQGKNPMVSNSLGSAISSLGASSGMTFAIEYINPLPSEMSMGFTHMILMIMTYISSYATAVVIANVLKLQRGNGRQIFGALAAQTGCALVCALLNGCGAAAVLQLTTGVSGLFGDITLFVAICSFAFQMLVLGSIDLFGMAVPIGILVIGMGTAYLPTEFLPAFWQDWIYPWDPLRFMIDGFRGILYMDESFWNPATPVLLVVALIGVVLMAIRAGLDLRKKNAQPKEANSLA